MTDTLLHAEPVRLPYGYARRGGVLIRLGKGGMECVHRADATLDAMLEVQRVAPGIPFTVLDDAAFDAALQASYGGSASTAADIELAETDLAALADSAAAVDDLLDARDDSPVIRLINALLLEAIKEGASDVHVETQEKRLVVRFRIDGVLRDIVEPPRALAPLLVSRIKVMAKLDIAERRTPQDGRVTLRIGGHDVDARVSTMPTQHGERVVLRLLERGGMMLDLAGLGMSERDEAVFARLLERPHGLLLVTGPTGSGKTTTLYAALAELNTPAAKLLTVEDPIEYRLPGVIQTQVNPGIGFTFATALRSFLRQDPDVMMVGEIRDGETAEIAVQAALTGHMILATLHTNSAAGAVTRLIDMKVEPFLLASVLTGVLAQRLVRRLCPECRIPYAPDAALLAQHPERPLPARLYHPGGCAACGGSGYSGRLALLEFLPVTEPVARMILASADARTIAAAAGPALRSLFDDGLDKAGQGLTSLEEVLRVDSD